MIEVELWDKDGLPLKYVEISVPMKEVCIMTPDHEGLNNKIRRFRYHGKSADLTDSGVSLRLVYKEV